MGAPCFSVAERFAFRSIGLAPEGYGLLHRSGHQAVRKWFAMNSALPLRDAFSGVLMIENTPGLYRLRKSSCFVSGHNFTAYRKSLDEGHGFHGTPGQVSRAVKSHNDEGFKRA